MKQEFPCLPKHIRVKMSGVTDTGQRRDNNEDNILVDTKSK